jgi:hypothetical protein
MTSGMLLGNVRFNCAPAGAGRAAVTANEPTTLRNRRRDPQFIPRYRFAAA